MLTTSSRFLIQIADLRYLPCVPFITYLSIPSEASLEASILWRCADFDKEICLSRLFPCSTKISYSDFWIPSTTAKCKMHRAEAAGFSTPSMWGQRPPGPSTLAVRGLETHSYPWMNGDPLRLAGARALLPSRKESVHAGDKREERWERSYR